MVGQHSQPTGHPVRRSRRGAADWARPAPLRPPEVEVLIPRSARTASVEVDGRPYLRKDADGLRLLAPVSDSSGSEIVFNVQP